MAIKAYVVQAMKMVHFSIIGSNVVNVADEAFNGAALKTASKEELKEIGLWTDVIVMI